MIYYSIINCLLDESIARAMMIKTKAEKKNL